MDYRAINKPDPNNELTHWKYIERKKVNGKWRYFYNDSELKKYEKGVTQTFTSRDGEVVSERQYRQTDNLFDSKETSRSNATIGLGPNGLNTKYRSVTTVYSQGKISKGIAKAEKWVFDNFLDPDRNKKKDDNEKKRKTRRTANKMIGLGRNKIRDLLSRL